MIARGPSFASRLAEAFDPIRQNAPCNLAVLTRLLQALDTIAGQTTIARRRQALRRQMDAIASLAENAITSPHDRAGIEAALLRLSRALATEKKADIELGVSS